MKGRKEREECVKGLIKDYRVWALADQFGWPQLARPEPSHGACDSTA